MKKDTLVVTATLGDRPTLSKTVESVRRVGGDRVAHLIVSPKQCVSVLQLQYPGCLVVAEPEGCRGIYQALNHGVKAYEAEYHYLSFLNDDDYWYDDYSILFSLLDEDPSLGVAYGKVIYVDSLGKKIGEQVSTSRYLSFDALLSKKIILFTQQSTLMRKEVFFRLNGFSEDFKLVSDTKFWLDCIYAGFKFQFTNSFCAAYMIQDGQLSGNKVLQDKEHDVLLCGLSINRCRVIMEVIYFRLLNIRIYANRIIFNKRLKR